MLFLSSCPLSPSPARAPSSSLTHQVLFFVLDGLGVVSHEAHSEDEIDNSEDGVQPKEVIAEGDTICYQGWASRQWAGVLGLCWDSLMAQN